jgi:tetratricopeptide (TPR) repeat protein/TolB-like protein
LETPADATGAFLATAVARKLPHLAGVYVVAAVAVFFALEVLVNRLIWSSHLPLFGVSATLLLLPAFLAVAYRRSARTIVIPVNLALGALVLWLGFGSKDLGAATRAVVVEDEEGNQIERVVPKSEFRKRFALFFFDNASGNAELDWLQYGLPLTVDLDLSQDMFVQSWTPEEKIEDLRRAGYPAALGVPFQLMRELAEEKHIPYIVSGSFATDGEQLVVTVRLHETRRGRLIAERTHRGEDVLGLADMISLQLRQDLEVPTQHLEESEDLPIQDVMTTSVASLRHLSETFRAMSIDEDWAAASTAVNAAIEADSTNAYAHLLRYIVSLFGNDPQGAGLGLQGAMQHIYRLPERQQFAVKMGHYEFNREPEKQLAVAEMWVEVFPDDVQAREVLTALYNVRRDRDGMIAQLEAILELDPSRLEILQRIGTVYQAQGEFDRATEYFAGYAEQFPDDAEAYLSLGQLLQLQGEFAEAQAQYERALLIDPNDVGAQIRLAVIERRVGNFDGELAQLEALVERSTTAQDSARVLASLSAAYGYRGQRARSLAYRERQWAVLSGSLPPVALLLQQLGALDEYVRAGREDEARQILAGVRAQLAAPFDGMIPVGELALALEVGDVDGAQAALVGVEQFITAFGVENLRPAVMHGTAKVHELRGQYGAAEAAYEAEIAEAPTDLGVHIDLARVRRLDGDLDGAERALRRALTAFPNSPTAHYQMALIAEQRGDSTEAVEHLRRSLTVWSDADEVFAPAREARERLAAIGGSM